MQIHTIYTNLQDIKYDRKIVVQEKKLNYHAIGLQIWGVKTLKRAEYNNY